MGGNIFSNTKRIDSKESFEKLFELQKTLLSKVCSGMLIPSQLTSKASFGDLDIIAPKEYLEAVRGFLELNNYEYSLSGDNLSYLYKNIQIDLIFIEESSVSFSQKFYSYSAQSRILSSAFRGSNFTLRPSGLYYIYFNKTFSFKKLIKVPYNHSKILELLKLDSRKFFEGFDTEEDVFAFISESPYLDFKSLEDIFKNNSNIFLFNFSEYISKNSFLKEKELLVLNFFVPSQYYLFYKEYSELESFIKNKVAFRNRFNGNIVNELTGLEGKDLKKFISSFKKEYSLQDILSKSQKQVEVLIKNFNNK